MLKVRARDVLKNMAKPRKRNIDDTPYSATAVSDGLIGTIGAYVGAKHPDLQKDFEKLYADRNAIADELENRAAAVYQNNDQWANKLDRSKNGLSFFYGFVQHWLASILHKRHRRIFDVLPSEFSMGHSLPEV